MGENEGDKDDGPSEAFVGAPEAGVNKWASCIRIVDPTEGQTLSLLELEDNESAFSLCMVRFAAKDGEMNDDGLTEPYLAVGTMKDYQINPPKCPQAFVRIYRIVEDGTS